MTRRAAWLAPLALWATQIGCPGFGDEYATRPTVPSYAADVKPVLERWCTSCHGEPPTSGAPMSLTSYEAVVEHLERVRVRTLVQQTMPPGGGLSADDRAVLATWIAAGAPPDPESPADAGPPDQGQAPTWADIQPVLMTYGCAFDGCHAGAAPQIGLDLSSYAGFLAGGNNGPVHGDGDPDASRLIDSLYGRNGIARMPLGGAVTPAERALFEAWIQAGYPEE